MIEMKKILDIIKTKNIAYLSASIAFFFGLLLILFGIWKTLFLVAITLAGYYIGKTFLSDKEDLKDLLDKIIPPGRFR